MEVVSVSVGLILAYGFLWIPLNVVFNPLIVLASINSHSTESHNLILYFVEKVCFVLKTPGILVISALLVPIRKAVLRYDGTLFPLHPSELHLSLEMLTS